MPVDGLWYLADCAEQRAERAYHRLCEQHEDYIEQDRSRRVSRHRFRTLAERVEATGAPYGAHTLVHRDGGELLLVRHEGVDKWVLPGGGVAGDETFREAAERELAEEAGLTGEYAGLAIVTTVTFRCDGHSAWGVLPVFEARADGEPTVCDPDDEISEARWFRDLPEDTRDRADILRWRRRRLH